MSEHKPEITLSLEQQFNLRSFETQVMKMSLDQAQTFLISMYQQQMLRDATFKQLLKHRWDINAPVSFKPENPSQA